MISSRLLRQCAIDPAYLRIVRRFDISSSAIRKGFSGQSKLCASLSICTPIHCNVTRLVQTHSSACTKGFAISSLPSTGLTNTSNVPRATTSPRGLEEVLPSSSMSRVRGVLESRS